jgi:ArsR family transcriptional regulator, cadmium/lead-responsive transcriptional repressor
VSPRDSVGPVFAALADPTRRHVVRLLARSGDVTATQLAGELPMSRQAVCKHLAVLEGAGLVGATRRGREVHYRLAPGNLDGAMRWMADVGSRWDERLRSLERHVRR